MEKENIENIVLLIGVVTPIVTFCVNAYMKKIELKLKDKELNQKITQEKQKEIFEKEIETYQHLYSLTIKYLQQKHNIGLYIPNANIIPNETNYTVYLNILNNIFKYINENIFYISDNLDNSYQRLFDAYEKELFYYNDSRRLNYQKTSTIEEEKLLIDAQEKFYNTNKDNIESFISLIQKEFKEKKISIVF